MKKTIGWILIIAFFFGCTPRLPVTTLTTDNWDGLKGLFAVQEQVEQAVQTLTAEVGKALPYRFGCIPPKPREKPKMPEVIKPAPPPPEPVKPAVVVKQKPAILSVKQEGNLWTVKVNKIACVKDAKVRLFIGYCYYEGQIQKDGTAKILVEWHPPSGGRAVSVFQQTDNPELGSGNTLCSMRI